LKNWPADRVERRQIDALIPYVRNSRTHTDAQIEQIAQAMREWGWTNPVLIDENGGIIAGHGRVLAARKLGFAECPVMVATGWTDEQKRAYVIADNKLTDNSSWDSELLLSELESLSEKGFDLAKSGFTDDELEELFGGVNEKGDIKKVETSRVNDRFWISVRGPLSQQAEALQRLQTVMDGLNLEIELGTVNDNGMD
jgi:hypothetical protein